MTLIIGAIGIMPVFLYGCLGETIMEKSGHLNLGVPGIMCAGTAGGCFGVYLYMDKFYDNPSYLVLLLVAILSTALFASLVGLIYAFLTVSLRCNQNITGLAITTFGTGFTQFFIDNYVNREYFDIASKTIAKSLSFSSKLGGFGAIFLSHGILVYLGIAAAIATALILNKTKVGLNLRAVGENPATADAAGINVTKYKYLAIIIGSAVSGLGGFFYIMDYIGGSWENASTIQAFGWLCIALVIFSLWRPILSILGSFIFAIFYILAFNIVGVSFTQMSALKLLPYVITIIVLIVTSIFGSKKIQPPASLGLNYFREDR